MMVATSATQVVVDDGSGLALISGASGADLAQARAVLARGGAVVVDPRYLRDGTITLTTTRGDVSHQLTVPGYALTSAASQSLTVLSPAAVRRAGFATKPVGIVVATTRAPSQEQRDALTAAVQPLGGYELEVEEPPQHSDNVFLLILAGAAGFIALGAAAIATGLGAVDSRPDLATLGAVGASPGLRRRLSLSQSGVIAGLGSLLGAVGGFGAAAAVLIAYNLHARDLWPIVPPYPIVVPWLSLGIAVVVVPVVAMLGAGLFTRSRLPVERRI